MNKKLEALMERVSTWPEAVQDEAAEVLAAIEEKHLGSRPLTPEEEAKLAALRETIERSIAGGGSYTDEEVEAYIEQVHARAEQESR
jgi:uncharacterized protein YcaQ